MTEPAVTVTPAAPAALNNMGNPSLSAAPKDRRQYTCLCGCMHLRTAALLIGAFQTLALICAVITVIVRYSQGKDPVGSLVAILIIGIVYTGGIICLFLAVARQFPRLLLPYLLIQVLAIVGLVIYAVVLSSGTIAVALRNKSTDDLSDSIGILVVLLLATGINTWFTVVVAQYFHFLRGQL